METACPSCQKSVAYGTLAVAFWVLHREFGFDAKRMARLKREIEAEMHLMETGIMGRAYSLEDMVRSLKEQFGVDFEESMFKTEGKQ